MAYQSLRGAGPSSRHSQVTPRTSASPVELRRFLAVDSALVPPPYQALHPVGSAGPSEAPPLGSITFACGHRVLGALGLLTATVRRFPWVAPSIAVGPDEQSLEPCIELVSELRDRLAVAHWPEPARPIAAAAVVESVRRRPPPQAEAMAGYICYRLGHRQLRDALTDQFREALDGIPATSKTSAATYSRLFARYGPFSARDWRSLARLTHALVSQLPGAFDPRDGVTRSPVLYRTALRYSRKLLNLSWSAACSRVGWEWVLERALRVGGYVAVI